MRKTVFFCLLIVMLAFGLITCSNSSGGPGGDYTLSWGLWTHTYYSDVSDNFDLFGLSLTPVGSNAGYLTGSDASDAHSFITAYYGFDDGGYETGSFENLVNFQNDGIGAPSELKSAMLANKNNVPLGGFFQANIPGEGISVVCFYVEHN